jgi:hypothetical protein
MRFKQYRQPTPTKGKFTVVKQQNVANGDQQIAYLDQSGVGVGQNKVPFLHSGREQESTGLNFVRPQRRGRPCGTV